MSSGQRTYETQAKAGKRNEESVRVQRVRMAGAVGVSRTGGAPGRPVSAQIPTEAVAPVGDTATGISLVASPVGVEDVAGMQAAVAATVGGLTAVMSL